MSTTTTSEETQTQQPLLSSIPYPTPFLQSEPDPDALYPQISFVPSSRPTRDLPWSILFLLFVLSTFGFGIFAIVHRNPYHDDVSSFGYSPTKDSCVRLEDVEMRNSRRGGGVFSSGYVNKAEEFEAKARDSRQGGGVFSSDDQVRVVREGEFDTGARNSGQGGGVFSYDDNVDQVRVLGEAKLKARDSRQGGDVFDFEDGSRVRVLKKNDEIVRDVSAVDDQSNVERPEMHDFFELNGDISLPDSVNKPRVFLLGGVLGLDSSDSPHVVKNLVWVIVITVILSGPFAFFLLFSLKRFVKQLVYVTLPFFVLVPVGINVYWFVACTMSESCSEKFALGYRVLVLLFVFLVIGVIVWIFVVNWHRVELTTRIIKVSADALSCNLGLCVVLPGLTLGLCVYLVPIVVFLVFANRNGQIVVKEKDEVYYCDWKQDSWVPAYFALAILTILWSVTAMMEAQVYVISGTIAQWYFSKEDFTLRRRKRSSLRNAFGPSSGTICLSGLLVCVVRVVRAAVDTASREDASGLVNLFLRCCVNALLRGIDFLNKFTINFAAITGEAYCTSAKMSYELLRRNLLSAVFVEIVSTRLLAAIIFVFSAIYAIVVCLVLRAVSDLGVDSYFVAAAAWILLIVILGYFLRLLDHVIDTVYICYAIDRDKGEVCKQDVHEVYVHLPISRNRRSSLVARTPLLV